MMLNYLNAARDCATNYLRNKNQGGKTYNLITGVVLDRSAVSGLNKISLLHCMSNLLITNLLDVPWYCISTQTMLIGGLPLVTHGKLVVHYTVVVLMQGRLHVQLHFI